MLKEEQKRRGDEALAVAETLVTAPKGTLAKMMWKRESEKAAAKFSEAGNLYAAAQRKDLAVVALQRAAKAYEEKELYYQAAQTMTKAASLHETDVTMWQKAGEYWTSAGERKTAADTYARGAKKVPALHELALDAASDVDHAEEIATQAFLYLVTTTTTETEGRALEVWCPKMEAALKGSLDQDHPMRFRYLTAKVILGLLEDSIEKGDELFLEGLQNNGHYAQSDQAKVADDILGALKAKDREALMAALQPRALAHLDFQIARLAAAKIPALLLVKDDQDTQQKGDDDSSDGETAEPPPEIDDDDELPDLS